MTDATSDDQRPSHPTVSPDPAAAPSVLSPESAESLATLMPWLRSPAGLTRLGVVTAAVLATALVSGVLYTIALVAPVGDLASAGTVFGGVLTFAGMALGAGISVGVFGSTVSATVFSLGSLLATWAAVHVLTRRSTSHERGLAAIGRGARTAVEAVVAATALTVLTAFASVGAAELDLFGEFSARPRWFTTWLVTVLVVVVGASTGRRAATRPRPNAIAAALREAVRLHALWLVVFGAVAVVATAIALIRDDQAITLLAIPPLVGNLVAAVVAMGHLGAVTLSESGTSTQIGWAWDLAGGHGAWLIALAAVLFAVAAVRLGVRRERSSVPVWSRTWQLPTITLFIWILLAALATGIRMSAGGFGHAGIGLAWWTPFTVAIAAGLISVGAEFAPAVAYALSPRLTALLAGSTATARWLHGPSTSTDPDAGDVENTAVLPAAAAESPAADSESTVVLPTAAQPPSGTATAPEPMDPRTKRRLVIGAGVVAGVALLIAGFFATVSILNSQRSPAGVVEEYLTLLADGDAEGAGSMVDPGIASGQRVLLNDEAMNGATLLEVGEVRVDDRGSDSATVTATLSLDGERFEHTFEVRGGEKRFGLLDTWRLDEPLLVPVMLGSDSQDSVRVGDAEVALDESSGLFGSGEYGAELYAYPGIYEVTAPESDYVSTEPVTLRVLPGVAAEAAVTAEPSDALREAVLDEVRARVEQCATPPTNMDDVCPYAVRDTDLAELTVTTQPEGFEMLELGGFRSEEAVITIRPNPRPFDEDPEPEEIEFSLDGSISIEDGEVIVDFDDTWW
ncbi:hypothetical protein BHE97_16165 [Aeromicrobium sp. PE09-221]|uniref:hypothetical protein n=1 Tax=Aeromicrobium sp. PE09-221 TaxID=1898043 RepID=UPI000B3EA19A|nr:hypothetical protein [Aeromicrobium sp. PE09-221]OUZ07635.1 hypothetical protein BHE97_16165 [Aeromicrobium sp. PE09-221]